VTLARCCAAEHTACLVLAFGRVRAMTVAIEMIKPVCGVRSVTTMTERDGER
jgi:hypothetical protein